MLREGRHMRKRSGAQRRIPSKFMALCAAFILLAAGVAGGTVAWLTDSTEPAVNDYTVGQVSCEVVPVSQSDGVPPIAVKNTSDDLAYIRVRLIGYCTDAQGRIVGGTGLPDDLEVNIGGEWISVGEYYYCVAPVEAGTSTPVLLEGHPFEEHQTVEVLAEAIQGKPAQAVTEAWPDVDVGTDGRLTAAGSR